MDKKLEKKKAFKADTPFAVYKRRFHKHKLGKVGFYILVFFYVTALFADVLAPYSMSWTNKKKSYHPPSKINLTYKENGKTKFKPFTYEMKITNVAFKKYGIVPTHSVRAISEESDPNRPELRFITIDKNRVKREIDTLSAIKNYYNLEDNSKVLNDVNKAIKELENSKDQNERIRVEIEPGRTLLLAKGNKNFLGFFSKGISYRFLNLFAGNRHFFGSETGGYYPMGADNLGRDLFSRLVHGSRISLSVGIIGALISMVIGLLLGGIAGYFGGVVDTAIMRLCEVIQSFPALYLLFTLRALLPAGMSSSLLYLLIIIILSMIGWARLARIIRGMVLSLKNEDYVLSAKTMGLSDIKIIIKHIIPNTFSYVIVQLTITIPGYILGESALSLLGLGITEPQSSWGNMLSVARNYRIVQDFPWILIPGFTIFLSIMAWNFFGDGVRDAVDPKSKH